MSLKVRAYLLCCLGLIILFTTAYAQTTTQTLNTPALIEADVEADIIDQETGYLYLSYALFDYQSLPEAYHSDVPWSGTSYLLQLQEAVPALPENAAKSKIQAALAGTCSSASDSLASVQNTTHFHIQYGSIGGGLDINDYANSLESTWTTEITNFNWAVPPVNSSNPPPGNRYHVRIDDLGGGLYGFVSAQGTHAGFVGNNPNTAWNDVDAYATCMVLNNNYAGFPGSPQRALDATTAHEFNHSFNLGMVP